MREAGRHRILRHAVAALAIAVAVPIKLLVAPWLDDQSPFLVFLAAVMAAAWFGGFWSGVVATALAVLAADFFFLGHLSFGIESSGQALRLAIFAAEGLVISGFGGHMHRIARRRRSAERAAEDATRELSRRLAELEATFEVAPMGLAIAAHDEQSVRANAAARRVLAGDAAVGSPAQSALPGYRAFSGGVEVAEEDLPMRRAAAGGVAVAEVLDVLRDDGSRVPVLATAVPLRGPQGETAGVVAGFMDLTLLRRAENAARESEQRFRVMADTAPVMIWMAGVDERRTYFSKPWLAFSGRSAEEEAGLGWIDGVHPEDRDRCVEEYSRAFDARREFRIEYRLRRCDGEHRWLLDTGAPRSDASGRFAGYVGSCVDITDRKLAEAEREAILERETAARAEAERANRLKDEFLATISHELRTPLNAILGWSRLLSRPDLAPAQRSQGIQTIARNATVQARIVEDILDASRIVTGRLCLEAKPIRDLAGVVASGVAAVHAAAEAKGVRLDRALDPYAGPVRGDPDRIRQIVWNLCSNAVKFTPRGGRVEVALVRSEGAVEIRVCDDGEGISPEFLPHVFERFRQADASTTRVHGGLGLGLAIARHLTELHGGTIVAESAGRGCGSTFVLRLPIAPDSETAEAAPLRPGRAAVPAAPWSRLDGRTVLAVDDDADALETVRAVLESGGARVLTASSAEEALAVLDLRPPHLLISDIGMPGRDGYWLIRQIRARGGAPARVPAIALTAYTHAEDRVRALSEGYQEHLAKPVEPAELLQAASQVSGGGAGAA